MSTNPDTLMIAAVPASMIPLVWGQCVPHLQKVVDRAHGEITLDSIQARLLSGNSLLVTIAEDETIIACNVLEVRTMDSGLKALYIPITGGTRLDEWMVRFLEVAKGIAKFHSCTELRGLAVRKGWMRVLEKQGWEEVHTVIKCDLGEE